MRKLAQTTNPTVVITIEGDTWTIETQSAIKTTKVSFQLDKTIDETLADGRQVKVRTT